MTDKKILETLVSHPILIERPILITKDKAAIEDIKLINLSCDYNSV